MTDFFLYCFQCYELLKTSNNWDELHKLIYTHKDETGHTSVTLTDEPRNLESSLEDKINATT